MRIQSMQYAAGSRQLYVGNEKPLGDVSRSGISLMEVLISIGIMAIGMLSIASLLPVGNIQTQRANVEERKAELGLNAYREFQIRGMGNTNNWLRWQTSPPRWIAYDPPSAPAANLPPLAIDPFMICAGGTTPANQAALQSFPLNSVKFNGSPPSLTDAPAPMYRVELSQAGTGSVSGGTFAPNRELAESIFTLTDDLVVLAPADRAKPAVGLMMRDIKGNPDPEDPDDPPDSTGQPDQLIKRQYEGAYSWLATLAPAVAAPAAPSAMSQYLISIVVFDHRPVPRDTAFGISPPLEQTVTVSYIGTGIGGGDVTMVDDDATKLELIRTGQWLMLCRTQPIGPPGPPAPPTTRVYKWYRVVSASESEQRSVTLTSSSGSTTNRTMYARDVTLAGPDWQPDSSFTPVGSVQTYACLFENAVAVYERVIHLEGPSIWGP